MADTGIFCTTAEVQYKAGAGASTTANVETYINNFVTQAESYINARCLFNWSDVYTSLNVDVKGILKDAASCIAAMYVINFDLNGYGSSQKAQMMLNFLWSRAEACITILEKKDKTQVFMQNA